MSGEWPRDRLDPEFHEAITRLPERDVRDPVAIRAALATEDRARARAGAAVDMTGVAVRELPVPAAGPVRSVLTRLYRPTDTTESLGMVLHLHSGGFYSGSLETEHWQAVQLARESGVAVLSVDYRLAPEHPYPAALEDCYRALEHAAANATELRVDPARLAVLGSSAGGGLAAALCLLTQDRGGPRLVAQFLLCPVLDDRLTTGSMRTFTDTPAWNSQQAAIMWQHYLAGGSGVEQRTGHGDGEVPIHAAPARASREDLRLVPRAFVATAQYDPMRDEALQYAQSLLAADVAVELHCYPRVLHGFDSLVPQAYVARQANRDVVLAVARYVDQGQMH